MARTTQSVLVVCQIQPGNFYYRGVRLSDGASIELANAVRSSEGFDVTNPTDGTDQRFGIGLGHAVDRLRDVVRRAILARLCLAEQPNPLWPFQDSVSVDSVLSDDSNRAAWRAHWRQRLTTLGVESAANPAEEAVDFLQPDSA